MAYIGKSPDGTGVRSRFYYTQTSGGGTSVSGSSDDGTTLTFSDGAYVDVYLNGVLLVAGTDYNTTTANTIAGLAALANGDVVEVVVYDIFTVADTVSSLNGGTFSNNVTINGDLTVDTNTLKVDSTNNRVGVGTTSPAIALETSGSLAVSDATTATKRLQLDSGASSHTINSANYGSDMMDLNVQAENLIFKTGLVGVAERMRIDSSGNVGIGATNPNRGSHSKALLVSDTGSGARSAIEIEGNSSNANGTVTFLNNGTSAASIDNRGSGELTFNNGSSLTERMRINAAGNLCIGKDNDGLTNAGSAFLSSGHHYLAVVHDSSNANDSCIYVNRQNTDGRLMDFRQANTTEGTIVVGGSTVTFNGGHLARWSRLADNTKPTTLLKGTVLTNLDAMIVWSHDEVLWTEDDDLPDGVSVGDVKTAAYTEDNEQLNHTAISSVEGDANVAGLFVSWDVEDGYNDFYLAMTGDMVIRIAQGTTVARGDLLMSAGDGTAKSQDDDIVRSKTIAKVTSTNVSHTYDDGSYLVPCVLMAC